MPSLYDSIQVQVNKSLEQSTSPSRYEAFESLGKLAGVSSPLWSNDGLNSLIAYYANESCAKDKLRILKAFTLRQKDDQDKIKEFFKWLDILYQDQNTEADYNNAFTQLKILLFEERLKSHLPAGVSCSPYHNEIVKNIHSPTELISLLKKIPDLRVDGDTQKSKDAHLEHLCKNFILLRSIKNPEEQRQNVAKKILNTMNEDFKVEVVILNDYRETILTGGEQLFRGMRGFEQNQVDSVIENIFNSPHYMRTSTGNELFNFNINRAWVPRESYKLCQMSSLPESGLPEQGKLYIDYDRKKNHLSYTVLNPSGISMSGRLEQSDLRKIEEKIGFNKYGRFIDALKNLNLAELKPFLEDILDLTSKKGHTKGYQIWEINGVYTSFNKYWSLHFMQQQDPDKGKIGLMLDIRPHRNKYAFYGHHTVEQEVIFNHISPEEVRCVYEIKNAKVVKIHHNPHYKYNIQGEPPLAFKENEDLSPVVSISAHDPVSLLSKTKYEKVKFVNDTYHYKSKEEFEEKYASKPEAIDEHRKKLRGFKNFPTAQKKLQACLEADSPSLGMGYLYQQLKAAIMDPRDQAKLEWLMEKTPLFRGVDSQGNNLLQMVILRKDEDVLSYLEKEKIEVDWNHQNLRGETAFQLPVLNEQHEFLQVMLKILRSDKDKKELLTQRDRGHLTPLMRAAKNGHLLAIREMLQSLSSDKDKKELIQPEARDSIMPETALSIAIKNRNHEALQAMLESLGTDETKKELLKQNSINSTYAPLVYVVNIGDLVAFNVILKSLSSDEDKKELLNMPMVEAVKIDRRDIIKIILGTHALDTDLLQSVLRTSRSDDVRKLIKTEIEFQQKRPQSTVSSSIKTSSFPDGFFSLIKSKIQNTVLEAKSEKQKTPDKKTEYKKSAP
jgi:ankyrin repeat protein